MRSAGCIMNDLVDRNIDSFVKRTKNRPIAAGIVRPKEAIILVLILLVFSFFPGFYYVFPGLCLEFPGKNEENPCPGQVLRVSYSKIRVYQAQNMQDDQMFCQVSDQGIWFPNTSLQLYGDET